MAATFAYLKDVRPYTTAWRVQVKVLHSWKQYTQKTGETLELIFSDEQNKKIHATIRTDLVSKHVNKLTVGQWVFVEIFTLNYAGGQFRPTNHLYKMTFTNGTTVMGSDPVSDSMFLSLAKFQKIQNGEFNPYILVGKHLLKKLILINIHCRYSICIKLTPFSFIDVIGQIVSIGELQNLEAANKPTTKIEFELRDETDERIGCTLWGTFAEQIFRACQDSNRGMVICILRFVKIKSYKGVRTLSNSFDVTQVHVNPPSSEAVFFQQALPSDGLSLISRERQPRWEMVVNKDVDWLDYLRNSISDLKCSIEIGKARVLCTIYAIDTDWAWYYISCKTCNKKVNHIHAGVHGVNNKGKKPRFWCDTCKTVVTNVIPRYMLYANVMDNTGEAKFLLFDSICSELIGESAASVLDGSLDEVVDPENLPEPVKNLIGKTFLFLVWVEKEHISDGKEVYKVWKVLCKGGLLEEQLLEYSADIVNPASIESADQVFKSKINSNFVAPVFTIRN
ncbi:putative replication protein A, OB [Arabidopsis thaliana]